MSNHIRKHRKESSEVTGLRRNTLFYIFSLSYSLVIPSCHNYMIQDISLCYISTFNSNCCKPYMFANCKLQYFKD